MTTGAMERYFDFLQRTTHGPGIDAADDGSDSIPKLKSVPNVSTARLERALEKLTHMTLTPEGLHDHDDTRRSLIELSQKRQVIALELRLRKEARP
jgi:hypothetical protein